MFQNVLVLNANFEPIHVCNLRRAMGLIQAGRAALVMNGRGFVHTVQFDYPRPSVIRLRHLVHRPRPKVKFTRKEVLRRDNFTCQYCGTRTLDLTIDHIIPRHLGGQHIWHNVVAACAFCNHRKGGRNLHDANMRLLRKPGEPPSSAIYLFGRHLHESGEWEPYLIGW